MSLSKAYAPATFEGFTIFPEAFPAIHSLRQAGFLNIVVTNQPDVATGRQTLKDVELMHQKMMGELPLDDIQICFHVEADDCQCRKPKPGLLLEAAKKWNIDLSASYMVGDRWKDIEAGKLAGCKTIFIESHYDEKLPENQDWTVKSILEASHIILDDAGLR